MSEKTKKRRLLLSTAAVSTAIAAAGVAKATSGPSAAEKAGAKRAEIVKIDNTFRTAAISLGSAMLEKVGSEVLLSNGDTGTIKISKDPKVKNGFTLSREEKVVLDYGIPPETIKIDASMLRQGGELNPRTTYSFKVRDILENLPQGPYKQVAGAEAKTMTVDPYSNIVTKDWEGGWGGLGADDLSSSTDNPTPLEWAHQAVDILYSLSALAAPELSMLLPPE